MVQNDASFAFGWKDFILHNQDSNSNEMKTLCNK